ncbi:MAG: hypothetical protein MJK15_02990 [Colwellia sp.]|nr:hypothetical protein [Colwellia sp.]
MKASTRKIRNKGYTILQFCEAIGYSLRWYREHCDQDSKQGKLIASKADELELKLPVRIHSVKVK